MGTLIQRMVQRGGGIDGSFDYGTQPWLQYLTVVCHMDRSAQELTTVLSTTVLLPYPKSEADDVDELPTTLSPSYHSQLPDTVPLSYP